jgi:hypothetical protein
MARTSISLGVFGLIVLILVVLFIGAFMGGPIHREGLEDNVEDACKDVKCEEGKTCVNGECM